MIVNKVLDGANIILTQLTLGFCNAEYEKWLNDDEVTRFLETRWVKQDLFSIKEYVNTINNSQDSIILAIITKDTKKHIGNIKIGPINRFNSYADISYFIGCKDEWGKGYATEAVKLFCDFAFRELELHKLQAGIIEGNEASKTVLNKAGFEFEGRMKEKYLLEGVYKDQLIYGLVKK